MKVAIPDLISNSYFPVAAAVMWRLARRASATAPTD